jgi:hypothetical protein
MWNPTTQTELVVILWYGRNRDVLVSEITCQQRARDVAGPHDFPETYVLARQRLCLTQSAGLWVGPVLNLVVALRTLLRRK